MECQMHFLEMIDLVDNLLKGVVGLPLQIEAESACRLVLEFDLDIIAIGHIFHNLLKFHIVEYNGCNLCGRHLDISGSLYPLDIKLTLVKKPNTYIEPDVLYAEAQKVLNKITNSNMTDMEKALKIFRWCRYNIHYITSTDTSSWTRAAYDALVKRQGTCYSFAMAARALLDCCGIPNMIVKRDPFRWSAHYWNLIKINGEWYHCDSTPRQHYHGYVFMMTDYELSQFRGGGYNGFSFKKSLYPKRSTTSVQDRINYETGTVKK